MRSVAVTRSIGWLTLPLSLVAPLIASSCSTATGTAADAATRPAATIELPPLVQQPTTVAPATTAAPTATTTSPQTTQGPPPNQAPNISLVSCQLYSVSGSSLNLKISVIDPDGDSINRSSIYVWYSHTNNTVYKSSQGTLWTQETTPGQYSLNWTISGTGGTPFPTGKPPLTLYFEAQDSLTNGQQWNTTITTTSCP